jgi:hypothetical protein
MKKLPLLLLVAGILGAGCGNDPITVRNYDMDGEWEVWTAAQSNDCVMLGVGAAQYFAQLESDAEQESYAFTGSTDGERCWPREYVRTGNQLTLSEDASYEVIPGECSVDIHRERVASFDSDDTFSEVSTVTVFCDAGGGCPPDLIACAGAETAACEARFLSIGLRCSDCWPGCAARAVEGDPLLDAGAAPGP